MIATLLASVRSWWGLQDPVASSDAERWVVVDVETSGLDAKNDRLLAIAAIGLRVGPAPASRPEIVLGDSFEVVLRQEAASDRDNILLHGIGASGAQLQPLATAWKAQLCHAHFATPSAPFSNGHRGHLWFKVDGLQLDPGRIAQARGAFDRQIEEVIARAGFSAAGSTAGSRATAPSSSEDSSSSEVSGVVGVAVQRAPQLAHFTNRPSVGILESSTK